MKIFMNQRGLAVLEVVIVATIVAIFAKVAVPQMARIYDKVQLDYEMKSLYSTLNLGRSIGKSASYRVTALGYGGGSSPSLYVSSDKYYIQHKDSHVYEHRLFDVVTLSCSRGFRPALDYVLFEPNNAKLYGKSSKSGSKVTTPTFSSGHLLIKSKYNSAKIIFDSVDRWRGEYAK